MENCVNYRTFEDTLIENEQYNEAAFKSWQQDQEDSELKDVAVLSCN